MQRNIVDKRPQRYVRGDLLNLVGPHRLVDAYGQAIDLSGQTITFNLATHPDDDSTPVYELEDEAATIVEADEGTVQYEWQDPMPAAGFYRAWFVRDGEAHHPGNSDYFVIEIVDALETTR